jgi:hypothetical protein
MVQLLTIAGPGRGGEAFRAAAMNVLGRQRWVTRQDLRPGGDHSQPAHHSPPDHHTLRQLNSGQSARPTIRVHCVAAR